MSWVQAIWRTISTDIILHGFWDLQGRAFFHPYHPHKHVGEVTIEGIFLLAVPSRHGPFIFIYLRIRIWLGAPQVQWRPILSSQNQPVHSSVQHQGPSSSSSLHQFGKEPGHHFSTSPHSWLLQWGGRMGNLPTQLINGWLHGEVKKCQLGSFPDWHDDDDEGPCMVTTEGYNYEILSQARLGWFRPYCPPVSSKNLPFHQIFGNWMPWWEISFSGGAALFTVLWCVSN